MLKLIQKLKKLMLYKNIKVFEYAINDVENCKNYKFYFYVNFKKHVYIMVRSLYTIFFAYFIIYFAKHTILPLNFRVFQS